MDNRKKVGYARSAIGLIVIAVCVYLLLNNSATAAESIFQTLL